MQRQPISPLIIILAVVAFLTACTPAAHYDGRLAAADSLMHDRPDSALAILQALHPDSLATQGDHAYRDLLLTQARYKCYITATTDSAINRALHYYRRHSHEQEKLTRAYIYKGAVMEELGHPDSAMHYYKTAEATAAPDDYFNLAYIPTIMRWMAKISRTMRRLSSYFIKPIVNSMFFPACIISDAFTETMNLKRLRHCFSKHYPCPRKKKTQHESLKAIMHLSFYTFINNNTNKHYALLKRPFKPVIRFKTHLFGRQFLTYMQEWAYLIQQCTI